MMLSCKGIKRIFRCGICGRLLFLSFDVLAVVALALYALNAAIFAIFVNPAYAAPVLCILMHSFAVGTGVGILILHGRGGRIAAGIILFFVWIIHTLATIIIVPFGASVSAVVSHGIAFAFPILFFIGVVKENFGRRLFSMLAVLYIFFGSIHFVLLYVYSPFSLSLFDLALVLVFFFSVCYPAYRLRPWRQCRL